VNGRGGTDARGAAFLIDLREVPVDALPWPWNPSRCAWYPRFVESLGGRNLDERGRGDVFRKVVRDLAPSEIRMCWYHATNWNLAAQLAVALYRDQKKPSDPGFAPYATRNGAGADEIEAVYSFWDDPIIWADGAETVTNGQHRTCALKVSGAEIALVEA
jgi:hypothetical protein